MGAQPRRDAARVADRAERRELGLAVEPVAGLRLERRRALHEASTSGVARPPHEGRPHPRPASRGRSRGCRRLPRAAPRSSRLPPEARTRRRGRRRTRRACGSRRDPESHTCRGRPTRRRRRRAPGGHASADGLILWPSQRTNASSSTSTSPSAEPRRGAPVPAGVASCPTSRISSRLNVLVGATPARSPVWRRSRRSTRMHKPLPGPMSPARRSRRAG